MTSERNAPCPCGSGNKYKKCCMLKTDTSVERQRLSIQRGGDEAIKALLTFSRQEYGDRWLEEVIEDFWRSATQPPPSVSDRDPLLPLAVSWAVYVRVPDAYGEPEARFPSDKTLAARFLRSRAARIVSESARRFIQAATHSPLAFHQILAVEPERGLLLRNLLTEQEQFVEEVSASRSAECWSILFGQVVEMPGICVFVSLGPYMLPPAAFRQRLENLLSSWREQLQQGGQDYVSFMLERDIELISIYHQCIDELLHPPQPDLRNTDGDKLEWCRSTYTIAAGESGRLLGRLESMRNLEPVQPVSMEVASQETEFIWINPRTDGPVPNAHRGRLSVCGDRLITVCNSRRRDRMLRNRLLRNLSELLEYVDTDYQPLDPEGMSRAAPGTGMDPMASGVSGDPPWSRGAAAPPDAAAGVEGGAVSATGGGARSMGAAGPQPGGPIDLNQLSPDERRQLEDALSATYLRWADTRVPALGGKTPRQMAATQAGRAEVAQMINDWEHQARSMPNPQFVFDFNRLRTELGLEEE